MKAIVLKTLGQLTWEERAKPDPGEGEVRIRSAACGVCATDLEVIRGNILLDLPAILGHEWSGTVDATGSGVDERLLGAHCVAENVLSRGGEVGFKHPGAHGEYFLTDTEKVHVLPEDFPFDVASIIEPLAVCIRGLRRLDVKDRECALILGDGPIGLITLMLLKHRGIENLFVVGGKAKRLELARKLGACATLNFETLRSEQYAESINREFGRSGFPNVIETSGSSLAAGASIDLASLGGNILILGAEHGGKANFEWLRIILREIRLVGSVASEGAWEESVQLATSRAIPLHHIISHRIPISDFTTAFETARKVEDAVKVIMLWNGTD